MVFSSSQAHNARRIEYLRYIHKMYNMPRTDMRGSTFYAFFFFIPESPCETTQVSGSSSLYLV